MGSLVGMGPAADSRGIARAVRRRWRHAAVLEKQRDTDEELPRSRPFHFAAVKGGVAGRGTGRQPAGEVCGQPESQQGGNRAPNRATGPDHRWADLRTDVRRAVYELFGGAEQRDQGVGFETGTTAVFTPVPLLDASPARLHARVDSNLVSVPHPDVPERAGMVEPADGRRGVEVPEAGQLLPVDRRLRTGARTDGSAVVGGLARVVRPDRPRAESDS